VRRTTIVIRRVAIVVLVPAMSAMHEQMHKRADQKEQPRQVSQVWNEMCAMFGHEKEAGDRQESDENDVRAGGEKAPFFTVVTAMTHVLLLDAQQN
jgi:hypothetical protein